MRIEDLIQQTSQEVLCLSGEETIDEAVRQMARAGATAVVVLENERPVGIFTRSDVIHHWEKTPGPDFGRTVLKKVMTTRLITAGPKEELRSAISLMGRTGIDHLPVVEGGKPVGLLTLCEAMAVQMDLLEKEVRHLSDYLSDLHDAGLD